MIRRIVENPNRLLSASLDNHEWSEKQRKKRENNLSELDGLDFNADVPMFTLEIFDLLGVTRISENISFEGTNLSDCEGKSIFELSQSKLEKLVLWLLEFSRDIRFIAMRESVVTSKTSVEQLKVEIEANVNHFYQQNANLTLRVHGQKHGTSKPIRNLSPGDGNYLKIEDGQLMLKLDDGEWLTFEPGQKLRIFPRPVSVDRDMFELNPKEDEFKEGKFKKKLRELYFELYEKVCDVDLNPKEKKKKIKKINMGGGFHIKLKDYGIKKVELEDGKVSLDKIFTLQFYFIMNNGEPRGIGNNNPEFPELSLTIRVKEENGAFVLLNPTLNNSLRDSINSQDMERVLKLVAENLISQESAALFKLFSVLLNLYPKSNVHLTQGFFSIEYDEKNDKYLFGTTTFDYGSLDERQGWDSKSTKTTFRNPSMLLRLVYEKLHITQDRELDSSDRLMLAQLGIAGYLWQPPTFEQFKSMLPNIESKLEGVVSVSEALDIITKELKGNLEDFYTHINRSSADDDAAIAQANAVIVVRKETEKIIKSLLGEKQYKNNSASSLFGRLMWVLVGRSIKLKKARGHDNVYEYQGNDGAKAILLNQGDHQIGFLVKDGKIVNLENILVEKEKDDEANKTLGKGRIGRFFKEITRVFGENKDNLGEILKGMVKVVKEKEHRKNKRINRGNASSRFKEIRKIVHSNFDLEIPKAMMRYVLGLD
jgi:hypothetical protein